MAGAALPVGTQALRDATQRFDQAATEAGASDKEFPQQTRRREDMIPSLPHLIQRANPADWNARMTTDEAVLMVCDRIAQEAEDNMSLVGPGPPEGVPSRLGRRTSLTSTTSTGAGRRRGFAATDAGSGRELMGAAPRLPHRALEDCACERWHCRLDSVLSTRVTTTRRHRSGSDRSCGATVRSPRPSSSPAPAVSSHRRYRGTREKQ